MLKRLLTVLLLLWSCPQVFSQSFTVRNYTTTDGLPSSEVYDIYQDKNGFLWFGTDNGIARFDGFEFKVYHTKDGLTDPVVFGFQEDDEGRVWFRTYSGKLSYMQNDTIYPYRHNNVLSSVMGGGLLNFHYFTKEKELWFTVRNRFGKIRETGEFELDSIRLDQGRDALHYVTVNDRHMLIRANRTFDIKSLIFNGRQFPVNLDRPTFSNKVFCEQQWNDRLYISIFNSLLEFDGKRVKKVFRSDFPIISLYADKENHLWVGYLNGGAEMYSDTTFKEKWIPRAVSKKSVTSVNETTDGGIWMSTLENGVYVIPNLDVPNFDLPSDTKIKVASSSSQNIIVASKSGTVQFYDQLTKKIVHEEHFEFDVLSIFRDRRDNIWISGHSHVSVLDKNFRIIKSFSHMNVVDFFESPGSVNLYGLGSQRIYEFDSALNLTNKRITISTYRQIAIDDSLVFLAGRMGLYLSDLRFQTERQVNGLENTKITELLPLNDSTLLISTMGSGFYVMNIFDQKFVRYNQNNNFISNNVYGIIVKNQIVWLGTEKGLVAVTISSLLSRAPDFNYLNARSGLNKDIVKFVVASDHEVWAFSETDFSVVPDDISQFVSRNPSFYIKNVTCNEKPVYLSSPLNFEHNENNLAISFGFISFNNDNVLLRYRLENDEPWILTKERLLRFSSLAPGNYSFELQYSVDNYEWTQALVPITFSIDSPWYKKWYVYPASIMLILLVAYWIFVNRQEMYREKTKFLNIINEHQQKLIQSQITTIERERNRIAKDLHDGVGTNLTAIKLSVRQLLTHYHDPLADDIEEQFQLAIGDLKNIIYDLSPPSLERYGLFVALKNYFNKTEKNLPINIELRTFGTDIDNYNINIMVFRIIQELLSNSIKHSNAKNIVVHLNSFEDLLSIIYEDNGVGFTYDPVQSGLGLDNVESRIRSLSGTLKFDSGKFGVSYNIEIPLNENSK